MAEESDLEKTEAATPRRLEKARQDGQIARSRELNTFMLLAAGTAALWLLASSLFHTLTGVFRVGMMLESWSLQGTDSLVLFAFAPVYQVLMALLPLFATLVIVALLSSVLLGGLTLSGKALAFRGGRLNPLKGVGRMFSAHTLVELFKTVAKAVLVGLIAVVVIAGHYAEMVALMLAGPTEALVSGLRLVALCCGLIIASLLLIVFIDAPWQLYSHFKKMRMSRHEIKEEHKESEGDPHTKARIRQQQTASARQRMMASLPQADVVVTNPTHYAVALKYTEDDSKAPRVVAKGRGLLAMRILDKAGQYRIPVLSAPPLARALYRHVGLGQEIPAALYTAVAEVLAWVYQLRHWQRGQGPLPVRPSDLPVPAGLDPQQPRPAETRVEQQA